MEELQDEPDKDQQENRRQSIKRQASRYLTDEAASRLGNIRVADPEMATSVESQILQIAKMGRIQKEGVTDSDLKDILKEIQNSGEEPNISFRK